MTKNYLTSFLCFILLCVTGSFVYLSHGDYFYVPVSFSLFAKKPLITATINDLSYRLNLDTGSCIPLCAQTRVTDQLKNKKLQGQSSHINIKGETFFLSDFYIPSLHLNSLSISDITISEQKQENDLTGGIVWDPSNAHEKRALRYIDGSIGWPILKRYYCLFDFPRKALFLSQNAKALRPERSMRFSRSICVPFQSGQFGIVITAETDLGTKRLVLDTGATHSALRGVLEVAPPDELPLSKSNTLLIGNHDFGKWEFVMYPIPKEAHDIDGILGIDFFLEHSIYIDPFEQLATIELK